MGGMPGLIPIMCGGCAPGGTIRGRISLPPGLGPLGLMKRARGSIM